jgi:hypothetical protein
MANTETASWHFADAECQHKVPVKSTVLIGTVVIDGRTTEIRGKRCKRCHGLLY